MMTLYTTSLKLHYESIKSFIQKLHHELGGLCILHDLETQVFRRIAICCSVCHLKSLA